MRRAFEEPDYEDALQVSIPAAHIDDIDGFAAAFFLAQPGWIRTVSMNLPSRKTLERLMEESRFMVHRASGDG